MLRHRLMVCVSALILAAQINPILYQYKLFMSLPVKTFHNMLIDKVR